MKMLFAFATALLVATSSAQAVEIRVLSGNGAKAAVRELCTQFERATGNTVSLHFEVNADLKKKIELGELFDVFVLNPPVIDALSKEGKIVAGSRADIGRSGLGVAVRKGGSQAGDLVGRGLQAYAACSEGSRLSGQGRQRPVLCQPARSHGHQG